MYKIALIDDCEDQYENYKYRLGKKGIELLFMEYKEDYKGIINWLLDNQIQFVLIDYKLDLQYDFCGSQLMQYINNAIPDLQCVLFTSNTVDDDLVMDRLKIDKSVFNTDGKEYIEFIETIKQAVNVFEKRKKMMEEQYLKLKDKKNNGKVTALEEEELVKYYKILSSYGIVEKIPEEMLLPKVEEKIDKLISEVEEYLLNKRGKNEKSTWN